MLTKKNSQEYEESEYQSMATSNRASFYKKNEYGGSIVVASSSRFKKPQQKFTKLEQKNSLGGFAATTRD